ncbi:MAG TPA: hypothetical protein VEJ63_17650 [Planctomycetota bacterium]|nr:hypothetical protein [Planctomycetota bacterium]
MPFAPTEPHISVALVIGGSFLQFGDPLDWIAQSFGLEVKVDRMELMVNLSNKGGMRSRLNDVVATTNIHTEAMGTDKRTRFRLQLFGRCEGRLVAVCAFSFPQGRLNLQQVEETAGAMTLSNGEKVLGIQATYGQTAKTMDAIENEQPLVRLLPLNVFNRIYFQSKIERIEKDKKLDITDLEDAVVVRLKKPWLYYDVPSGKTPKKKPMPQLPF